MQNLPLQAGMVAVHYGASTAGIGQGTAPADRQAYKEWFASTEANGKRPDLLVFDRDTYEHLRDTYRDDQERALIDMLDELTEEQIPRDIVCAASSAVEVENSTYRARRMTHYGKPSPRLWKDHADLGDKYHGRGFSKSAVLPTIYIKQDDLDRLRQWRDEYGVNIFMAAFFADEQYLLDLRVAEEAIADGAIAPLAQSFSANESKVCYKVWYTLAMTLADAIEPAHVDSVTHVSDNGKITAEVVFLGGRFALTDEAAAALAGAGADGGELPLTLASRASR